MGRKKKTPESVELTDRVEDNSIDQQLEQLPEDPYENMAARGKRRVGSGRRKGSQNKVTGMTKEVIFNLLNDYQESGLMASDFLNLESKDRITMAEKFSQYVLPKMQSTSVDFGTTNTKVTIDQKLIQLSEENDI